MAETSLGRASLSVTADLSGFTNALDQAAQKTNELTQVNSVMADAVNQVTTAAEQQTKALEDLQAAAVAGAINAETQKQQSIAARLTTEALVAQSGAAKTLALEDRKLAAEQSKLATNAKALEFDLTKNDKAFRSQAMEIQKNIQKQQLYEQSMKVLTSRMMAGDQESIKLAAAQKKLGAEAEIAAKKMDLESRQILLQSGATAKLYQEMAKLEKQELAVAAAEEKLKNQFSQTTKAMGNQAAQGQQLQGPTNQQRQPVSLGVLDYIGIGIAVDVFKRITDGIIGAIKTVISFTASIIDAGAKFQQWDIRLQALTGSKQLAKDLQNIMKAGPSASFEALATHATRLAALKFDAPSVAILIKKFNELGIALGDPERIMALIVDKIGDMAADGRATMPALSKLAEEGIPVWEALAARLSITTGQMVSVAQAQQMVKDGLINVTEATAAIGDAAGMNGLPEMMQKQANSFYGIWSTVANNLQVLFQKIGGFFVDGFSLVNLSEGIQNLFNSIGKKLEDLKPWFTKAGAFISSVIGILQETVTEFFDSWAAKQEEFDLEKTFKAAKLAAIDFSIAILEVGRYLANIVNKLIEIGKEIQKFKDLAEAITFVATTVGTAGSNLMLEELNQLQPGSNPQGPNNQADEFFNAQVAKLEEIKRQMEEKERQIEEQKLLDYLNSVLADPLDDVGDAVESVTEKLENLNNEIANINRIEPKLSDKWLTEHLTPLQIYEKEIAKLNLMLAEGANGELAFAMGSADALAKLKQATGLGQGPKFAGAITAGSAEDFQANIDRMGKNVDVQQQIKELMEEARRIQEAQLQAQKDIAAAIRAQPKPPKPVNQIAAGM